MDRRALQLPAAYVAGGYLQSVYHQNRGTEERRNAQRLFFRRHGMDENLTDKCSAVARII